MVCPHGIFHDLIDLGLVHLQLAILVEYKLAVWLFELRHHLDLLAHASVIHSTLLRVGFVYHSLILIENEIGLGRLECGCGVVHSLQDALEGCMFCATAKECSEISQKTPVVSRKVRLTILSSPKPYSFAPSRSGRVWRHISRW